MSTMIRGLCVAGVLAFALVFLAGPAASAAAKERWQKAIPEDAFKQLLEDEAKVIQEKLKSKEEDDHKRAELGAMLVIGFSLSHAKPDKKSAAAGGQAEAIVKAMRGKGKLAEARKLADGLTKADDGTAPAKINTGDFDLADVMNPIKLKTKGGDGIHADLQINIKLKGTQNGIEELLRALAMKRLTDANVKKTSKELALLAYRLAVIGEIAHDYAPKKGAKEWQAYSLDMRSSSLDLAKAAQKQDIEAVFDASNKLMTSCNVCHFEFRKK